MATIADVARLAKVSKTTVSRYLNNQAQGHMSAETGRKIQAAIKELHYNPSAVAQSLKKKCTNMIGLVVHDLTNPFLHHLVLGVETELQGSGMSLLICSSHMDLDEEIGCVEMLNQRQVDGILLVGLNYPIEHILKVRSRVPIVLLERDAPNGEFDSLKIDNTTGVYQAVEHLIGKGHIKIAHIRGPQGAVPAMERYEAYKKCLLEHGITPDDRLVLQGDYKLNGGYEAMAEFMRRTDKPTAIFCANDVMAMGVVRYALEKGISIPKDVALVGYDDIDMVTMITPALTTVRQPVLQLAKKATRILLDRIQSEKESELPNVRLETHRLLVSKHL